MQSNNALVSRSENDRTPSERTFACPVDGRNVPVTLWLPVSATPCPLVLVGHGGAGHKRSQIVLDLVKRLTQGHQIAVAAIDGPVHGDRRNDGATPDVIRDEFRALWEAGGSVDAMVADWRGVLDALSNLPEIDATAIGYYGLSMGTAYGLPFLATETAITVAVLGMWGTSRVNSERLLDDARNTPCKTMFCIQWDDELFTREGQFELFDALANIEKQMNIHPGGHVSPEGDRLDDIVHFLTREIGR